MRQLALGFLVGILSLGMPASAGEREWYVGIEGGAEFSGAFSDSSQSDTGLAVLATVGRKLGPHFSVEGELGYRSTDEEMFFLVDIDQISAMVNVIYDIPVSEEISLSLGAGVGWDHIQIQVGGVVLSDDSDVQTAAQLKFGLSFEVSETTDLYANYRLMTTFENDFTDIDNSTLTVGLRFAL